MPDTWRTVRVFISSTFRDMQAERDHLVRFVFPKLREELLKRRIHFIDVDLRWGVTSDQDASEVCREIVDECRPRFLCMLGGRYGCIPPAKDESITADEVHYGVLDRDLSKRGFAYFYFRDPSATMEIVEKRPGDFREPAGSPNDQKLRNLKESIVRQGLEPFIYPAKWDAQNQRLIGLTQFGDRVYTDIMESIDYEFGTEAVEKLDEFAEENIAMEVFIEERIQRFVLGSRETVWNELIRHTEGTGGNGFLCLIGEPGSGKSALLAKFSRNLAETDSVVRHLTLVVNHFIGASSNSTDGRHTLRRLCRELVKGASLTVEIPDNIEELHTVFPEILKRACAKVRVVLLLDAVNQFDPGSSELSWLPEKLPDNARIIITTLAGPALDDLRHRSIPPREVMLSPLSPTDVDKIINEFLRRYHKSMTPEQCATLRAKANASIPLYLLSALEELRTLGTYEEITDRIHELPETTQALFTWILQRLENDPGFRDARGQLVGCELVSNFSSLLCTSRHGLSQHELADLLAPGDLKTDPPIKSDSQGNVSALLQLLRPYMMHRGELLNFYHDQFRAAAAAAWIKTNTQHQVAHEQLANYFRSQADPEKNQSWKGKYARPFLELPFHMTVGKMGQQLESTLSNFKFLEAKLSACGPRDLLTDFDQALSSPEGWLENAEVLRLVGLSLKLCANILAQHPNQLAPQLIGRLMNERAPLLQELVLSAARNGGRGEPWLRPLKRCLPLGTGALMASVRSPHLDMVKGFVFTPDGKKMVSWDVDGLYLWSTDRLELLRGSRAPGYGCTIQVIAPLPDNKQIVVAMDDSRNTVFVWNTETNDFEEILNSQEPVRSLAVADKLLVTAGGTRPPQVYDIASHRWVGFLPYDQNYPNVRMIIATRDGSALIGVTEDIICRWSLPERKLMFFCQVRHPNVDGLCITADGRWLLTVGGITYHDRTVRFFDALTGERGPVLEGHSDGVVSVAVDQDLGWIYTSSRDRTVGIWDLSTGRLFRTVRNAAVWTLTVTPSGTLITERDQNEIQLWKKGLFGIQDEGDMEGAIDSLAMDSKGSSIVAACCGESLLRWTEGTRSYIHLEVSVQLLAITDDGRIVFGALDNGAVAIWSVTEGRLVGELEDQGPPVTVLRASDEGRVVVARKNGVIRVWQIVEGLRPSCLVSYTMPSTPLAVSPDGRLAVLLGSDSYADPGIFDVTSAKLVRHLRHKRGDRMIGDVAISGDGTRVALASGSWRTRGGSIVLVERIDEESTKPETLEDYTDNVSGLAFSYDGRFLVTCDVHGTLLLWNIETKKLIRYFGSSPFCTCGISSKGHRIVAGDRNGFIHLLAVETGKTLDEKIIYFCEAPGRTDVVFKPPFEPEKPAEPTSNPPDTEDLDRTKNDALSAVRSGNLNALIPLVTSHPSIVNRDICFGSTLLHYAVMDGHYEIARFLLARGSDVNSKDDREFTPLHWAAYGGNARIAKLLIDAGASIDSLDDIGMAPLHNAAFQGHTDVVKVLLFHASTPVDQRDRQQRTPLHAAALGCQVGTADFLLSNGADVNALSNDGQTPLDLAWYRPNNKNIVSLLKDHGGKRKKNE